MGAAVVLGFLGAVVCFGATSFGAFTAFGFFDSGIFPTRGSRRRTSSQTASASSSKSVRFAESFFQLPIFSPKTSIACSAGNAFTSASV